MSKDAPDRAPRPVILHDDETVDASRRSFLTRGAAAGAVAMTGMAADEAGAQAAPRWDLSDAAC